MNDDGHVVCYSLGVKVLMNGYGKAKTDVPIKQSNSFELVFNYLQFGIYSAEAIQVCILRAAHAWNSASRLD